MVAVPELVPNASQRGTLIAIGVMMFVIAFFWFTPFVSKLLYPFKVLLLPHYTVIWMSRNIPSLLKHLLNCESVIFTCPLWRPAEDGKRRRENESPGKPVCESRLGRRVSEETWGVSERTT